MVSQSVMYIVLDSINKLTEEQERNLNILIPYNLEFYVVIESKSYDFEIKETYSLSGTDAPGVINDYGYYSRRKGLISSGKGFYERRLDLNGTIFTGIFSTPVKKNT